MEISKEKLEKFEQMGLEGVELSEEELESVSGGAEGCSRKQTYTRVKFDKKEEVQYIASVGAIIHCYDLYQTGQKTVSLGDLAKERVGTVIETMPYYNDLLFYYMDRYKVETIEGEKITGYVYRDSIIG